MNFNACFLIGTVCEVDATNYRVKVEFEQLDGFKSAMLPMLTTTAQHRGFYSLPEQGSQVVVLLDHLGNGGVVLGSLYNAKDRPQQQTPNITAYNFANGTEMKHDESTGQITITTEGGVQINADVVINGNLHITGTSTADVDHISNGISGQNHTHPHGVPNTEPPN